MNATSAVSSSEVLVVVPAFNEEESIAQVVAELKSVGLACVVVDDSSSDATASRARAEGAFVLTHPFNLGVGGALRTGFKFAELRGYRAVVQVDADGQHPIHEITKLINTANESGADLVLGSRFIDGHEAMTVGASRRLVMHLLARIASRACGTSITDSTSGFRLIRGQLLHELALNLPSNYLGDTFEALVSAGHAGYQVVEIPASIIDRTHGISTASRASAIRFTLKGLVVALLKVHTRIEQKISS